ncbi:MAG: helix-turn-helix domain-containing protein [Lactobacillus sp.]|jgi:YesN/AraC family two-component response regulator|nr:helix-turn-helix domain-containing protein [Lactobacillus sp.]
MVLFQHFGLENSPIFKHFELTNFNFPVHLHRAYELILIQQGQLHLQIEEQTYRVNARQFALVFPNQMHSFEMAPNTKVTIVLFSPEIIGAFNEQYQDLVPENPIVFYNQALNFNRTATIFGIKSLLYGLCDRLVEQTTFTPRKTSSRLNIVHNILDYVNAHYMETCTLKQISQVMEYDYVYLSKLFQQVMGMAYTQYLNRFRISKARQLLKNTDDPITQIAFNVGYANQRTFNRNFKVLNKLSPAEYRRSSAVTWYEKSVKEDYISG